MILVEIATTTGPIFINPERVDAVVSGGSQVRVFFANGESVEVNGPAENVARQLTMESF